MGKSPNYGPKSLQNKKSPPNNFFIYVADRNKKKWGHKSLLFFFLANTNKEKWLTTFVCFVLPADTTHNTTQD